MYTVDTCPHVGCGYCKYFEPLADRSKNKSECKRIDHKKVQFKRPIFTPSDYGYWHIPCADFVPKYPEYADYKEWTTFEDFWPVYVKSWLPYEDENILQYFALNGNQDILYGVPLRDFIDGTMISDGVLHAVEKMYYKGYTRSHNINLPILHHDKINGVVIDTEECL